MVAYSRVRRLLAARVAMGVAEGTETLVRIWIGCETVCE